MNELNINILQLPARSLFKRILGVLYLIMGISWFLSRIIFDDPESSRFPLPILDLSYIILFGFSGIIFIIEGYGVSIARLFGEAYIRIGMEGIFVKKGVFSKEWVLLWSDIEQVEYKVIKIHFKLKDNSYHELDYDNLDYGHIQEIKKALKVIAKEKSIEVIGAAMG